MRSIAVLAALVLPTLAAASVEVEWVEFTAGVSIALDASDNVFTAYYSYSPGGDITVTKRNLDGGLLWESTYDQLDGTKWEKATWVQTDRNGSVLVSGSLMSGYSNPVNAASTLMKFNADGDLEWRKVFETDFDGSFTTKCLVDEDDNIYVLGMGSGAPGFVAKVKKFAPDGTVLWTYHDTDGIGRPVNFKLVPGDGIVIAARSIFGSINGYAKIDRDGNRLWGFPGVNSLTVGDADGDELGNTYLVHGVYEMGGGTTIKKLSPGGALLWSHDYDLAAFRVEVGGDDHPVVCGFPDQNTPGAAFLKADPDGGIVWSNPDADGPLGLLLHAHMIMDADDNIYLAAGLLNQMAVCKVDRDGTSAWTATTPGSNAYALALGSDRSVYVVDGATAKLRQSSPAEVVAPALSAATLTCAPNPCRTAATIQYRIPSTGPVTLRLHDSRGNRVAVLVDEVQAQGRQSVQFGVSGLTSGVYYYQLQYGATVEGGRLTVVK